MKRINVKETENIWYEIEEWDGKYTVYLMMKDPRTGHTTGARLTEYGAYKTMRGAENLVKRDAAMYRWGRPNGYTIVK